MSTCQKRIEKVAGKKRTKDYQKIVMATTPFFDLKRKLSKEKKT